MLCKKNSWMIIIVAVSGLLLFWPVWPVLQVSAVPDQPSFEGVKRSDGSSLLQIPLLRGRNFALEYLHSVHKTPVREEFVAHPGRGLILTSTSFQSYGVGTPYEPGEGRLIIKDGYFVLCDLDRQLPRLDLRVVPLNHYRLYYAGKCYPLNHYFAPGALVQIWPVRQSSIGILLSIMRRQ